MLLMIVNLGMPARYNMHVQHTNLPMETAIRQRQIIALKWARAALEIQEPHTSIMLNF
jgi:hypothetical protein